jgi:hypothetical protein
MSALPTSPWHSTSGGPRTHRAHQGPSGPKSGSQRSDRPARQQAVRGPGTGPGAAPTRAGTSHGAWWVLGAGQARRRGQQAIGQGELIQQQAVQPAGVGGQQGFDQRGCGWPPAHGHGGAQHHRHGPHAPAPMGTARWSPECSAWCTRPRVGTHARASSSRPASRLPCARTGTRAHGGAHTLVGPWQRQAAWQMKGEETSAAKTGQRGGSSPLFHRHRLYHAVEQAVGVVGQHVELAPPPPPVPANSARGFWL